jgi:hypothetical protein
LQSTFCKVPAGNIQYRLPDTIFFPLVLLMVEELNISPTQSVVFYMDEQPTLWNSESSYSLVLSGDTPSARTVACPFFRDVKSWIVLSQPQDGASFPFAQK